MANDCDYTATLTAPSKAKYQHTKNRYHKQVARLRRQQNITDPYQGWCLLDALRKIGIHQDDSRDSSELWGTKRYEGVIRWNDKTNTICLSGYTAWAPPENLHDYLAINNWTGQYSYDEPGMNFAGKGILEDGTNYNEEYYENEYADLHRWRQYRADYWTYHANIGDREPDELPEILDEWKDLDEEAYQDLIQYITDECEDAVKVAREYANLHPHEQLVELLRDQDTTIALHSLAYHLGLVATPNP